MNPESMRAFLSFVSDESMRLFIFPGQNGISRSSLILGALNTGEGISVISGPGDVIISGPSVGPSISKPAFSKALLQCISVSAFIRNIFGESFDTICICIVGRASMILLFLSSVYRRSALSALIDEYDSYHAESLCPIVSGRSNDEISLSFPMMSLSDRFIENAAFADCLVIFHSLAVLHFSGTA